MPDEPSPPVPTDPHRRRFFRMFAGDVASSVGSMLGAARTLQSESASAAQELLGITGLAPATGGDAAPGPPAVRAQGPYLASTAGYRTPFRFEDDAVFAWDQRQLPDILVEIEITSAADAVRAIMDGAVVGAAVQAQLAAATVALVAARAWDSRPFARRATIRGAANALRMNRPASAQLGLALDRMLAIVDEFGIEADGKVLADALRREAEEIIVEATEDHGRIAEHAPGALPGGPDDALHVLTTGNTGAMGSGVFGTALGVITSRHHAGQPIHALVAESRPWLAGARVACWELGQAGVPHALVTDAAAPGCIAAGEVQAVLLSADRVAANGDIATPVGAYALALAAQAEGVPVVVCVATTAMDTAIGDGDDLILEEARPLLVLTVGGQRIAPEGVHIRNPVTDVVPASLIAAFITDEGVLRPPFGPAIADAVARSSERRMVSRGYRALTEQRQRAAEGPAPAEAAAPEAAAEAAGEAEALPEDVAAARAERQAAIRAMASGLLDPARDRPDDAGTSPALDAAEATRDGLGVAPKTAETSTAAAEATADGPDTSAAAAGATADAAETTSDGPDAEPGPEGGR